MKRFNFDARIVDPVTKKASLLGDSLDDETKKELGVKKDIPAPKEDISLPPDDELTPIRPLPGAPAGQRGEVEEEYSSMSAEDLAKKREQQKKTPSIKGEPTAPAAPDSFRDIMRDLLKSETPQGKREEYQLAKYGPPETIGRVIDSLTPLQQNINVVDVASAQSMIANSDLPDLLKDRAQKIFDSRSSNDRVNAEKLALNLMKATTKNELEKAKDWFMTDRGQQYLNLAFDLHRIRKVMGMFSNTMLTMEGQSVIDQPPSQPRSTPEQRAEKKRINGLLDLLNGKRIDQNEFDDAKRTGKSADEVIAGWAVPKRENIQERVEREYREKERAQREKDKDSEASNLNMRKEAEGDVTGPGGDEWEYEWTSGPSPTKMPVKRRNERYPFHNRPSGYTPGEGDQGNLHAVGPLGGLSDENYLAKVINLMQKTADNDLFSTFSFNDNGPWLTYTLFRKAYSKFRVGDVVIQYGKTEADCSTFRRRFGTVKRAKKSIVAAIFPILATVVSQPTKDDTLHDLQKGAPPGGAYGPHTSPYDVEPWHGNRDGFDAKNPPRQRTNRKVMPYMDQADDEGSGFTPGRTMGSIITSQVRKIIAAMPVIETPEERAGTIEQPPIKPINHDPKRPTMPKKRFDTNEQQLTNTPAYQGEDSSGFDRNRMRLSMKKPSLNMKKGAVPTYEEIQTAVAAGQFTPEEAAQMIEYYQLVPAVQQPSPEISFPADDDFQKAMTGVTEFTPAPGRGPGAPGRFFLGENDKKKK